MKWFKLIVIGLIHLSMVGGFVWFMVWMYLNNEQISILGNGRHLLLLIILVMWTTVYAMITTQIKVYLRQQEFWRRMKFNSKYHYYKYPNSGWGQLHTDYRPHAERKELIEKYHVEYGVLLEKGGPLENQDSRID